MQIHFLWINPCLQTSGLLYHWCFYATFICALSGPNITWCAPDFKMINLKTTSWFVPFMYIFYKIHFLNSLIPSIQWTVKARLLLSFFPLFRKSQYLFRQSTRISLWWECEWIPELTIDIQGALLCLTPYEGFQGITN